MPNPLTAKSLLLCPLCNPAIPAVASQVQHQHAVALAHALFLTPGHELIHNWLVC
jgi:hypothetical protein